MENCLDTNMVAVEDANLKCCEKVLSFLNIEKRFLNPSYSLWEMSRDIGVPVRKITTAINSVLGQNFLELLNRLRVKEAQKILSEAQKNNTYICIEDVYIQSGFGSRSAFYLCFKKYVGVSPRQYIKMNEIKKQNSNI